VTDLLEVSPASEWCQRWETGRHTWRHRSDGGFDPARFTVDVIADDTTAKGYILDHHYSGSYPSAKLRYGLYTDGHLVGVCVLGFPPSRGVLTNPFPGLEPYVESVELSRLVLADACPANSETWFITRCFDDAALRGIRGVVSFADPVPRRVAGDVVFPGHVGIIYQARNAIYTGRGTARTLTLLPDGTVLNDRAQQKVRAQERGHRHVEERLIRLGAPVPRAGQHPAAWLTEALTAVGATRVRHRGNHRYCFTLGTRAQRRRVELALPASPYPKRRDAA